MKIESKLAMTMVMNHHYSQRKVGSKCSFGLFNDGEFVGCCVFSIPASYTLCNGVCGPEYRSKVLELSRLVVTTTKKNAASYLIGNSLKMIGDAIVVSYADTSQAGHIGYVYQATNWIYTGRGNAEPAWAHPSTGHFVSFTRRHIDKKAEKLGLCWKDLIKVPQLGKHRYVTFAGSKRFKNNCKKRLRYPILPYPKGTTTRHTIDNIHHNDLFSQNF
jgi:hypothetical protein